MNLSGILVIVPPSQLDTTVSRLNGLPGLEVHYTDPNSGRIVVVQEAENIDAEVKGLESIQRLPHVVFAKLVYHYFEEDAKGTTQILEDLNGLEGLPQGGAREWLNQ